MVRLKMLDPTYLVFTQLVTLNFNNALTPSIALPDFSNIIRPFNIHEKIVNDSVILNTSYGSVRGITREIQYDIKYSALKNICSVDRNLVIFGYFQYNCRQF